MGITHKDLANWFTYHPPRCDEDIVAYQTVREAGLELATVILEQTVPCADQSAAIRKVREAVMTANAARACTVLAEDRQGG